ncbi:hypothetical protein RCJ22_26515 [Vibrio sp. FNV 38]|nr:hypothetical protein [Vibrio sp. FNV 38]
MKNTLISAAFAISSIAFSGATLAQDTISAVGSSSVTPLMETFGEIYSKAHPNIYVEVSFEANRLPILLVTSTNIHSRSAWLDISLFV